MVKMVCTKPKWLAALIIVIAAALFITGCPSTYSQPPVSELPTDESPANQPPVIDSLTCQWWQVKTSMSVPVECAARDPDGDELSYVWSVDGVTISGDGVVGDWFTPEDRGTYTITVTVSDGNGGQDTASLEIRVACCLREVGD
jgi:hypothetical protein